jgi:hypothetical protein
MQHPLALVCVALSLLTACHGEMIAHPGDDGADAAVDDGADAAAPTWDGTIASLLVRGGCTACHGDAGRYSVETYAATLAPGSDDVANVLPGDPDSALVRFCAQGHGGLAAPDAETVERWVLAGAAEATAHDP